MKRLVLLSTMSFVLILSLFLSGCTSKEVAPKPPPQATAAAPAKVPAAVQPTSAPASQAVPTAAPKAGTAAPAAPAAPAAKPKEPQKITTVQMPKFLRMKGAADPAGSYAHLSVPVVMNIETAFKDIRVRDIPGGSREGIERIDMGDVDLAVIGQGDSYGAWFGLKEKGWNTQIRSFRLLFSHPGYGGSMIWGVPGESPVKQVKDLYNKKINPGLAGYSSTPGFANVFKLYNITWESIIANGGTVYWGNPTDAWEMVAAGRLDAAIVMREPYAPVVKFSMTRNVRIIGWTKEEQDAYCDPLYGAGGGYMPSILKANTYKGQTNDVLAATLLQGLAVSASMPDDVVYNILWALFAEGRYKTFQEVTPGYLLPEAKLPDNALKNLTVPLHPGAEKFWKDWGFTIPKSMAETTPAK